MTDFSRTGKYFAFEQVGIVPDIICLSKGLTGGFMPLGLTVVNREMYDIFHRVDSRYVFSHRHPYTANPLACAAAVASLQLLKEEQTLSKVESIENAHQKELNFKRKCVPVLTISGYLAILWLLKLA
jgi:adenosylmethionine-8-amino-7-oxononanoate aminotransferase